MHPNGHIQWLLNMFTLIIQIANAIFHDFVLMSEVNISLQ